jgi:hypothetical protein
MPYVPTTAELRDAFRRGRLWWLGWTFEKAQSVPYVAQRLSNQVREERRRREARSGRLPVQMDFMEGA